jgi:DNA-binding NarL/FixJ family response regulator
VLLDVRLGEDDGFALCGTLTRQHPELAVLIASDGDFDHIDDRVAGCGARGVVRKSRLAQVDLGEFWPAG